MFSKKTLFALLLCFVALVSAVGACVYILNNQRSVNPATITCQTIKFEFERPFYDISLLELVTNTYTDDEGASITLGLFVGHYNEQSLYDGSDCITMNASVSARVPNGFVESVNITFWEDYQNSLLYFYEVQHWPKYHS